MFINRLRSTYTKSPKYLKKSAPMIGETSAMVTVHVNALANPKTTCTDRSPKVWIDDPFAACSIPTEAFWRSSALSGKTLISAPASMRYLNSSGSTMVSKRLDVRRSAVATCTAVAHLTAALDKVRVGYSEISCWDKLLGMEQWSPRKRKLAKYLRYQSQLPKKSWDHFGEW